MTFDKICATPAGCDRATGPGTQRIKRGWLFSPAGRADGRGSGCGSGRASGLPHGGFTLVEVLVALSIVAIALTAGTQATLSLTRNAERQSDVLLAHVCAENEMVRARLSRQMPGVGDTRIDCKQAGRNFAVAVSVRPTPNPNFRRIDAEVFNGPVPVLKLSAVLGQY